VAQRVETREERPLKSFWLKDFLAVDTTNSRIALPNQACMSDLLNAQPVGFSNIHSIADISAELFDFGAHTIYAKFDVNINGTEYLICAAQDGTLWYYDVDSGVAEQMGAGMATDMSAKVVQYDYSTALVLDSSNYWYWKGPSVQTSEGIRNVWILPVDPQGTGGAPVGGDAIAVYNNMVWIAAGRQLYYSKAGAATDTPPAYSNFLTSSGGGYSDLTDATLRSRVTGMIAANGYLYLFGETSIDAISDVYVPSGLTTPTFTRLNLTAIVGTDQPHSIFALGRLILFANKYGMWMIYGMTVQTISGTDPSNQYLSEIDGTIQYLNFNHYVAGQQWLNNSNQAAGWENNDNQQVFWQMANVTPYVQTISGGQVISNRLMNGAFLVVRQNDPIFGSGALILMYQSDAAGGKWWSALYTAAGEMTFICTAMVAKQPALFCLINNRLYQILADLTSSPAARIKTGLWDLGDPLTMKQAVRAGVRVSIYGDPAEAQMNVYLDTLRQSFPVELGHIGAIQWVTNIENPVAWMRSDDYTEVYWIDPVPYLNYWGKAPECYSPYLGFTITTEEGTVFELNQLALDYKLAARWTGI
jgi:hypothetical protein